MSIKLEKPKTKKVKVNIFREYAVCKKCGGNMEFLEGFFISPRKYLHKCELCKEKVVYLKEYPNIIYENIE